MTDDPAPTPDADRRRLLRAAGLAAGAAWAAPIVVSATPAAAGTSPDPCAPAVTTNTSTCSPPLEMANYGVSVPLGCPEFTAQAAVSTSGGPFVDFGGCEQAIFSIGVGINLSFSRQVRIRILSACNGTVLQEFLSPVYSACPVPGDSPDGGGATSADTATLTVTRADGSTEVFSSSPG